MTSEDPRRQRPIEVKWVGEMAKSKRGSILIDGEVWAYATGLRRAGLDPDYTPHDLRHSWASWHYAVHKDLLRLKQDGGWSSVALVERYAHLMPQGQEAAIRRFLSRQGDTSANANEATA
jgi:integrase